MNSEAIGLNLQIQLLARALNKSKAELQQASARAAAEKSAVRLAGWFARLKDLFTTSAVEVELQAANGAYERAVQQCEQEVSAIVLASAEFLVTQNSAAAFELARLRADSASAKRQYAGSAALVALGNRALSNVRAAASQCSSASTTEMLDMFSKNKGISLMSALDTDSAKSSLQSAERAVNAFSKAMASAKSDGAWPQLSDTFDFLLDMVVDLPFDFTSWSNMNKLDEAADHCKKVARELERVLGPIRSTMTALAQTSNEAKAQVDQKFSSYIDQAVAELPSELVGFFKRATDGS